MKEQTTGNLRPVCMASRERDTDTDLENGGTTSEEDRGSGVSDGFLELHGLLKGNIDGTKASNALNFDERALEKLELLVDKIPDDEVSRERLALLEMKLKEKEKKKKSKFYKPPRPPKGPALDATDMKMVRELSELAMRKRMRIERVKALKKSRAANSSSSNSSLTAMIITVLFCLVIVFQGICSREVSSVNRRGLQEPAATVANGEGLISVRYPKNITSEQDSEPSFESPS